MGDRRLEDSAQPSGSSFGDKRLVEALVCQRRGFSQVTPLGPDFAEQHLHSVLAAVDGVQQSRQTQPRGGRSLLPRGLPPAVYAQCAVAAPSRTQEDPTLPVDLDFAIRVSAGVVEGIPLSRL